MTAVIIGGHMTPALATIDAIQELKPDVRVVFFGRKHAMEGDKALSQEYKIVKDREILFYGIVSGRLQRKFTKYTVASLAKIPIGFLQSLYLLLKIRPFVIVSYGGYLAVPIAVAGWFLRIPVITHEQTLLPGLANKILARFASKIALTFPDSSKYYLRIARGDERIVVTGNPIRKAIFRKNLHKSVESMRPLVFVSCGNQGSHFVNELIFENLNALLLFCDLKHQTGRNTLFDDVKRSRELKEALSDDLKNRYAPCEYVYEDEIGSVLDCTEVVVSRGGVNTLLEMIALGKKGLIIPGHAEQLENGKFLEQIKLGRCVEPEVLKREGFCNILQELISAPPPMLDQRLDELYDRAEYKLAKLVLAYCDK